MAFPRKLALLQKILQIEGDIKNGQTTSSPNQDTELLQFYIAFVKKFQEIESPLIDEFASDYTKNSDPAKFMSALGRILSDFTPFHLNGTTSEKLKEALAECVQLVEKYDIHSNNNDVDRLRCVIRSFSSIPGVKKYLSPTTLDTSYSDILLTQNTANTNTTITTTTTSTTTTTTTTDSTQVMTALTTQQPSIIQSIIELLNDLSGIQVLELMLSQNTEIQQLQIDIMKEELELENNKTSELLEILRIKLISEKRIFILYYQVNELLMHPTFWKETSTVGKFGFSAFSSFIKQLKACLRDIHSNEWSRLKGCLKLYNEHTPRLLTENIKIQTLCKSFNKIKNFVNDPIQDTKAHYSNQTFTDEQLLSNIVEEWRTVFSVEALEATVRGSIYALQSSKSTEHKALADAFIALKEVLSKSWQGTSRLGLGGVAKEISILQKNVNEDADRLWFGNLDTQKQQQDFAHELITVLVKYGRYAKTELDHMRQFVVLDKKVTALFSVLKPLSDLNPVATNIETKQIQVIEKLVQDLRTFGNSIQSAIPYASLTFPPTPPSHSPSLSSSTNTSPSPTGY